MLHSGSLLLTGATIHTASGPVLTNAALHVEGDRIRTIGSAVPPTADVVVDLTGLHLYPGLIAATTSLGLSEIDAVRATRDMTEVGGYTPEVQSWLAVNPDSELIPVARANGVTHALVVPEGGIVAGQSGLIRLTGWTAPEMTVRSPVALHVYWPSMALDTTPKEDFDDPSKWKSLEDQGIERKIRLNALSDFILESKAYEKAASSGRTASSHVPAWEAMRPFVSGKSPVIVHADELQQIRTAVAWARTNALKLVIAGGRDAWRAARLLAENDVPVIFERVFNQGNGLSATPAQDTDRYDVYFSAAAALHQAGVKVIFSEGPGGDGAANVRNLPYAAAQAAAYGLPASEALRGITLYPAQILGISDQLGSLEPGKEATFFASTGDILDIRSRVTRLWIGGNEVSLDSRHTRLYEKYRNRPRPGSAGSAR